MQPNRDAIDREIIGILINMAIRNAGGVKALATSAGINPSNLHSYRRGAQIPHFATCARIAALAGYPRMNCWRPADGGSTLAAIGNRRYLLLPP